MMHIHLRIVVFGWPWTTSLGAPKSCVRRDVSNISVMRIIIRMYENNYGTHRVSKILEHALMPLSVHHDHMNEPCLNPHVLVTGVYCCGQFGRGGGPIHQKVIQCTGKEQRLSQCNIYNDTMMRSHSEDVGIRCYTGVLPFYDQIIAIVTAFSFFAHLVQLTVLMER